MVLREWNRGLWNLFDQRRFRTRLPRATAAQSDPIILLIYEKMQSAELVLYVLLALVLVGMGFIMWQQYSKLSKEGNVAKGGKKVAKKGRKAAKSRGYWGLE